MTKRAMDDQQPHGAGDFLAPSSESTLNGGLNNNEAKRVKLDTVKPGNPSRVIHIRNIPTDVSEAEIIHLGIPFGRVTNVLVLKGKNQAFLEMEAEQSAVAMVNYFTNCVAQLRERSVYVQFSNHKELKTDKTHSNANASAQAAIQAAQALSGAETNGNESSTSSANGTSSSASSNNNSKSPSSAAGGGPNTVLRVVVEQMVYPVTLDVIYQIFTRMGKVLKIVTFTKNNTFQALIQYPDVIMAQAAKMSLDGQNIYNACCKLKIEYSKLSNLNVRYNNDKSRDYTRPSLPPGGSAIDSVTNSPTNTTAAAIQQLAVASSNPTTTCVLGSPFSTIGLAAASHPLAGAGYASPVGITSNMATLAAAGFPLADTRPTAAFRQSRLRLPRNAGVSGSGCVLLVSNLDENNTEVDHLFTLFGVYGDVQRVKILFKKKDSALVQMSEPQQALLAINYLDNVKLWNKEIKVMPSKHVAVQLPKEGQPDTGLTKDYSTSSLHRFKKPQSKNYHNIYPPSATLHLSNIPSSVEEENLRAAFSEIGLSVQAFKFFPNDRKMALVQLSSVDEAVLALIKLHNYQLSETSHLRVSFSKSTI